MALGEKITELRKKYNLTQEKLAEKLEVSRQTVSSWESNNTSPDLLQASKLVQIFKISLDELIDNNLEIACKNNLKNDIFNNLIGKSCHLNISEELFDLYLDYDKPVKILEIDNDFVKIEYENKKEKYTKLIDTDLIISIKVVEGEWNGICFVFINDGNIY